MERTHNECFPLQSLPDDVLEYVSRFLYPKDLRTLRMVNRCFSYHPRIIRELQRRMYLCIDSEKVGHMDCPPYPWLRDIQHLQIWGPELECLQYFTNARSILVNSWANGDPDYSNLKFVPLVEELLLYEAVDADWSPLLFLPRLQKLRMEANMLGNLTFMESLGRLRELHFGEYSGELDFLRFLPSLEVLKLSGFYDGDLAPLQFLSYLQQLSMRDLCNGNLIYLPPSITKLNLRSYKGDITPLGKLHSLKFLDLTKYEDGHFDRLPPSVQKLRVMHYSESLTALCCCHSVRILELKVHKNQDLNDLSPLLPLLQRLFLQVSAGTNLSPLGSCFNLRDFCLWNYEKGDLTFLSFMCSLTRLYLIDYEEGDLTPLSFLFPLQVLDLSAYSIRGDITPLASLWNLQELVLDTGHPCATHWKDYLSAQRTIQRLEQSK